MKIVGVCLLLAGFVLVLSALVLLRAEGPRGAFILAGLAVELLGFGVVIRSHLTPDSPVAR